MPDRPFPHLAGLRAVTSVLQEGTVTGAAEVLRVTPGAISQQIAKVEAAIGAHLFVRAASGMTPTPLCLSMRESLEQGFSSIEAAVRMARNEVQGVLTISVAPIFAARWLIWRLPKFAAKHPDIRVRIDADLRLTDPGRSDVDLCIRVGHGGWEGVTAERMFDQIIFPVCSPQIADQISGPEDLARFPVVRDINSDYSWDTWFGAAGVSGVIPVDGPAFSDTALCLDAAISGAGVLLAFETLAADALAAGRIVAPFKIQVRTGRSYWLITAQNTPPNAAIRKFSKWLQGALADASFGREVIEASLRPSPD